MNFRIFGPEDQETKLEKNAPQSNANRSVRGLVSRRLRSIYEKFSIQFSSETKMEKSNFHEGAK